MYYHIDIEPNHKKQERTSLMKLTKVTLIKKNSNSIYYLLLISSLLLSLSSDSQSHAAMIELDQSTFHENPSLSGAAITNGRETAQTFTVGKGGILAQIDLHLFQTPGAPGDIILAVRRTENDLPTSPQAPPIFQTIIPNAAIPEEGSFTELPAVEVDVTSGNIDVAQGERMAVTLKLTEPGGGSRPWTLWAPGITLPGASAHVALNFNTEWGAPFPSNFGIQNHILVPEPSTYALAIIGAFGLMLFGWRRRAIIS